MEFAPYSPSFYKPGLPYHGKVCDSFISFIFNNNNYYYYYIINTVHTIQIVEKKVKRNTILIMFTLIIS